jgi:hypothetical protein
MGDSLKWTRENLMKGVTPSGGFTSTSTSFTNLIDVLLEFDSGRRKISLPPPLSSPPSPSSEQNVRRLRFHLVVDIVLTLSLCTTYI